MKKRSILALISVLTVFALLLTGCSGKKDSGDKPNLESEKSIHKFLKGEWLYTDGVYIYTFDGKGHSTFTDQGGTYKGKYKLDGNKIEVFEDGKKEDEGHLTEDGKLIMSSADEGWFYKKGSGAGIPSEPYCDNKPSLKVNMDYDEGRYSMRNGGAYIRNGGKGYQPGNVSWEITPYGEYMDDYDTNAFKAVGLFAKEYAPQDGKKYEGSGTMVFYDYYTGNILPLTSRFKMNKKGWYEHDFDTKGGKVHLEIHVEEKHQGEREDYSDTVTYIYEINKPDWYAGLVMAFIPQPETYKEKKSMDNYEYYKLGMKIDEAGLDMENALKCIIE